MKIEIVEKLAETIYSHKAYPGKEEIDSVEADLIEKHPCLKEPSSTFVENGPFSPSATGT